jgi:hypothetical protein
MIFCRVPREPREVLLCHAELAQAARQAKLLEQALEGNG